MLDPDLLDSYEPDIRVVIEGALMSLASTGVLLAQKERLFRRVMNGSDTEDAEDLTARILDYRKSVHGLVQMHNYGINLLEESKQ